MNSGTLRLNNSQQEFYRYVVVVAIRTITTAIPFFLGSPRYVTLTLGEHNAEANLERVLLCVCVCLRLCIHCLTQEHCRTA